MVLENWGWIDVNGRKVGGLVTGLVYSMFAETMNPKELTYEKLKMSAAYSSKSMALFKLAKALSSCGDVESS